MHTESIEGVQKMHLPVFQERESVGPTDQKQRCDDEMVFSSLLVQHSVQDFFLHVTSENSLCPVSSVHPAGANGGEHV